jgi:hypothetical protein
MDRRRRFVPSTEGLEGRALLASGLFGTSLPNSNPAANVPMTMKVKEQRIERLPHYMELIRSGRFIPPDTVRELQADMLAITAKVHRPHSAFLEGFNSRLRSISFKSSLSVPDAAGLNHSFGLVLQAMGASPEAVTNLKNDMNALAKNDAMGPQPVFVATNDYTLVLQTILGIGPPIRRPQPAQLAIHNGKREGIQFGITPKSQPTLVGNYDAFSLIQVVDTHGNVLGTTTVKRNGATESNGQALDSGKYAVTINQPISVGVHTLYVRGIDSFGNVSPLSPFFKIRVLRNRATLGAGAVPGGPLAMKQ